MIPCICKNAFHQEMWWIKYNQTSWNHALKISWFPILLKGLTPERSLCYGLVSRLWSEVFCCTLKFYALCLTLGVWHFVCQSRIWSLSSVYEVLCISCYFRACETHFEVLSLSSHFWVWSLPSYLEIWCLPLKVWHLSHVEVWSLPHYFKIGCLPHHYLLCTIKSINLMCKFSSTTAD